ncbi:hypothetical protein QHH11_00645 [Aphanizomenon sp. PH219]|nr:hypothetical protein [Aphanizomenon sp. 202]MDK2457662.1 hypothetical protein [Aphanizomenon sp. PH219]
MLDTRNNGLGITLLEQAGIAISVGLLQAEAKRDMGLYLWKTD